ncbi:inositol-polyphosphate multikinase [Paxillus involutus ATCC 200175]|uniref:Kinase n=1 Tax=Paxillus involutus ATCC 200175 TaxID=664439 RepID=A0A0C9SLZ3_PAXIN|nr:inositol-polyphosphate multikinase [Paxillus involutus ATCC 200175]
MDPPTSTRPRHLPKRSRTLAPATALSQQVGGHAGVQTTEDESLLLKPALPREITFYQLVRDIADASTGLHLLKEWIPTFFGVLNLEGKLADPVSRDFDWGSIPTIIPPNVPSQTLVLQNLIHGYRKPCILDVKLGTVLYDEDAPEAKKARMIKTAKETTSFQTGVRLTGFQVYSNFSPHPIAHGKAYGKTLKPEQLHEGIELFFPCCLSASLESNSTAGLPPDTLLPLLTSVHASLTSLRKALEGAHLRMVGGSVLIIYEGDWERAAASLGRGGGPGSLEEDQEDQEDEGEQIEVEVDENGEILVDSIPDISESSTVSSSSTSDAEERRLYTVALIDFAHTRIVSEGPDRGVLKGMDTLLHLIDKRRKDVAELVANKEVQRHA